MSQHPQDISSNTWEEIIDGVLITANVIIDCLVLPRDPYKYQTENVLNLILQLTEYLVECYITPIDRGIVQIYLECFFDYISEENRAKVASILKELKDCPIPADSFDIALNSGTLHPPDAVRLHAAHSHNLQIITWEPDHFASSSAQRNHIKEYGYVPVLIGEAESICGTQKADWTVFVFSVASFVRLMPSQYAKACDPELEVRLAYSSYDMSSTDARSRISVELLYNGSPVTGIGISEGPIDALFLAIENAAQNSYPDLPEHQVGHRVSDRSGEGNIARVSVRCVLGQHYFEQDENDSNTLVAIARAYTSALNAMIVSQ